MRYLIAFLLLFQIHAYGNEGNFSGRVSKVNVEAGLMRVKVTFSNMKYLNKHDKVKFWNDYNPLISCDGYIIGKTPDYLLLKVSEYEYCSGVINMAAGRYLLFHSKDLENNLKMGQELISVLLKKRLAISGKVSKEKKGIDSHLDRVEAVNKRFTLLREKLEKEWRDEISSLEEDYTTTLINYKALKLRLDEIEHKMELYRIEDSNFEHDRWSLDTKLYYKK